MESTNLNAKLYQVTVIEVKHSSVVRFKYFVAAFTPREAKNKVKEAYYAGYGDVFYKVTYIRSGVGYVEDSLFEKVKV